jgi:hypothetical protein
VGLKALRHVVYFPRWIFYHGVEVCNVGFSFKISYFKISLIGFNAKWIWYLHDIFFQYFLLSWFQCGWKWPSVGFRQLANNKAKEYIFIWYQQKYKPNIIGTVFDFVMAEYARLNEYKEKRTNKVIHLVLNISKKNFESLEYKQKLLYLL